MSVAVEYKESYQDRMMTVVNYIDDVDNPGALKRVFTNTIIHLEQNHAKPILTFDNNTIGGMIKKSVVTPQPVKNSKDDFDVFIGDPYYEHVNAGQQRFKYIGLVENPINHLRVMLVYDRKFKDIIIMPPVDAFNNKDNCISFSQKIRMPGTIIGASQNGDTDTPATANIPISNFTHIDIPEPAESCVTESFVAIMPAADPDNAYKDLNFIEKVTGTDDYIMRGEIRPVVFVKLGKISDLYPTNQNDIKLPVYLTYQYSVMKFMCCFLNMVNTKDRDLYVVFSV